MSTGEDEIQALTGLRFIAAFYVFLFHIHIRWPLSDNWFVSNILNQGAIGMSVFFLLSGFVLTYRYSHGRINIRSYFANRFARIYPIYAVAAIVTLPWFGVQFSPDSLRNVAMSIVQSMFLLLSNVFLIQAWFVQLFPLWNVGSSWSISVEAFCYVLLPFLLPFLIKLSWRSQKIGAFICVALATAPGLSAKAFASPLAGVFYSMPIFRLSEFVLGCLVCLAWQAKRIKPFGSAGQLLLLGLLCTYLGIAGPIMPLYVGHNWIVVPAVGGLVLNCAYGGSLLSNLLSMRLLVWLGKISYCFYSFQALIILLLVEKHDQWVVHYPTLQNNYRLAALAFLSLLIISAAGYYLIEEPARRALKHLWLRHANKAGVEFPPATT